jgi:hypothetical protein
MKCRKCHTECDDRAKFCSNCGSPLEKKDATAKGAPIQHFKCPSCNTLFTVSVAGPVTVECPGCSRHLTVGTAPQETEAKAPEVRPPPPPPPKAPPLRQPPQAPPSLVPPPQPQSQAPPPQQMPEAPPGSEPAPQQPPAEAPPEQKEAGTLPEEENLVKFKCPKCTKLFAAAVISKPCTTNCPYCNQVVLIQ